MAQVAEKISSLQYDLLVFTGDLADGAVRELAPNLEPLKSLSGKFGKFYITGNHEYYWGVEEWTQKAQDLGFDYLFNEHRLIKVKNAKLLLGGVPDYSCSRIRPDHKSDPSLSIKNSPESDFKILLAHQPKSCFEAVKAG